MMFKAQYEQKDEIPKGAELMYEEKDGLFIIKKIDGLTTVKKLEEFEKTNKQLKKVHAKSLSDIKSKGDDAKKIEDELASLKDKYKDIDIDAIVKSKSEAIADREQAKKQKDIDDGKWQEVFEAQRKEADERATKAESLFQQRIDKFTDANQMKIDELNKKLQSQEDDNKQAILINNTMKIREKLSMEASNAGVNQKALNQFLDSKVQDLSLKDGEVIVIDKDNNQAFGSNGVTPVTVSEFVTKQVSKEPFWFNAASGAGITSPVDHSTVDKENLFGIELIRANLQEVKK